MIREIKFRAWDKTNHRIREVIEISFTHQYVWTKTDTTPFALSNQQYELMQYTGLKDKNGKEIYEGDILKNPHDGFGRNELVEYSNGIFWATPQAGGMRQFSGYLKDAKDCEIIGNIYENPELVKKE